MSDEFYWVGVTLIAIMSSARLTRLVTWDEFPPVRWMRDKFADATDGTGWQILVFCGYCFSFWATAAVVGTGWWAGVADGPESVSTPAAVWLSLNAVFGLSYAAAIVMANDGDNGDEDDD